MMGESSSSSGNLAMDCDNLEFIVFCKFCEKVRSTKKRVKKIETIRRFFSNVKAENVNFFPVMRLLLPQWDRDRSAYGLKEHNLAKKYIKILGFSDKDPDSVRLLNFKAPSKAGSAAGDFAEVIYDLMLTSSSMRDSDFKLFQINNILNEIAVKHSKRDPRGVENELSKLIDNMSAFEQKWLARLLLKSIHLGVGYREVLSLFHPDAPNLHDACSNLYKICDVLRDPNKRMDDRGFKVELFDPFKPMLSERCDVQALNISETYFLEPKWDGERFQLHYSQGKFKYFSRRGFEYTYNYGKDEHSGYFTPKIYKQFKPSVNSCILDGEMMGWSTRMKKFGTKAMNFDVKLLRVDNIMQPCFCVFDVLHLNGLDLTCKPFHERMFILDGIFDPLEGVIIRTESTPVESTEEVLQSLNQAIDNREEGIILKHPESLYKPNGRQCGWLKIKPEYTEGAMVDLDLLIIGGYYGEKCKSGKITQFLLGLKKEQHNDINSIEGDFVALSKVGSGLNDNELENLDSKLQEHWIPFKPNHVPTCLNLGKEKPDFLILPSNSIILQVRATEVINSGDFYPTGFSLRFVRVQVIRHDKPWYDALTVDEFHAIRRRYGGKLTIGHIVTLDELPKGRGKKRKIDEKTSAPKVSSQTDTNIFLGKEFFVASGTDDITVQDMKNTILRHSGQIADTHGSAAFCSLAGSINVRVQNLKSSKADVVNHFWLLRCLENARLMPLLPEDFISMNLHTDAIVTSFFHLYKNNPEPSPNFEFATDIVNHFENYMDKEMSYEEVGPLYYMLFKNIPENLFNKQKVYFDIYSEIGNQDILDVSHISNEMYYFKMFGGTILPTLTPKTTLVIMHENFLENLPRFLKIKKLFSFEVISYRWIKESVASGNIEEITNYLMNS